MLEHIYIDGFRHFKNFSLEPYEQTTLLCGLNGSGKTTIVEILSRVQRFLVQNQPVSSLSLPEDIPQWELKEFGKFTSTLGFTLEVEGTQYKYEIEIQHLMKEHLCRVNKEYLELNGEKLFTSIEGNVTVQTDDAKKFAYPVDWDFTGLTLAARNSSTIRRFLEIVKQNLFIVSLNPFAMPGSHQEQEPLLNLDGSNISGWYSALIDTQLASVAECFTEIQAFIPGFRQFTLNKEGKAKELQARIAIPPEQTYSLSFEQLSHGQRILCILHLLIKTASRNSTIIIDEFENFLSPVELQPLYNAAQEAYEERQVQFIFVSHHEKTLNWFQDCAVVLSFSGTPAFVRVEKHNPANQNIIDTLHAKLEG